MRISEHFFEEYKHLEKRVKDIFEARVKEFGSVVFYNEDDDEMCELYDCPTTYYTDNNGRENWAYITKIDSEGIRIVECDDTNVRLCINFAELSSLFQQIEMLDNFEKN